MTRIVSLLRAAASAALLFVAHAAPAQMVVARVNGVAITQEQFDRSFDTVMRERKLNITRMQNQALVRELKREALDRQIREELFWQQAKAEGLVASDADVDKGVAAAVARAGSRDNFQLQLVRLGIDERRYREDARRLLSADRYAQGIVDRDAAVTDADVENFYRANPALFEAPERIQARTIAIDAPATTGAEARRAARKRIDALRAELAQGADFDQLARTNSDDPTRQWGGQLDPASPAQLPEWMRAPVAKLTPGQLSPVIETPDGFHLVKLESRVPARRVPLPEARQGIYDHLRTTRAREALDAAAARLRAQAKVEVLVPF